MRLGSNGGRQCRVGHLGRRTCRPRDVITTTHLAVTVMDAGQPIILSTSLLIVTRYLLLCTRLCRLIRSKGRALCNMPQIY